MNRQYLVLLAEDNPGDVFLVREALREHGLNAEVHAVDDGEKAIAFLREAESGVIPQLPDLFLIDINLPRRTGHEVLKTIRSGSYTKQVPVVLLTSSESPRDKELAAELGASACFIKPAGLDEFLKLGALAKSLLAPEPGN